MAELEKKKIRQFFRDQKQKESVNHGVGELESSLGIFISHRGSLARVLMGHMFREQAKTKRMRFSISQKPLKGYIIYVISRKKNWPSRGRC